MRTTRTRVATLGGALLLPLVVGASTVTVAAPAEAEHRDRDRDEVATYEVIELGPAAGGTGSAANSITDNGWVGGTTDLPGVIHATVWRDGEAMDLGTLGGANSAVLWPNNNTRGLVVGVAETAKTDPRGEDWSCSAFFPTVTHKVCSAFVWEDGEMRGLPTFGGTHGFATSVNNDGLVVGWAETRRQDSSCEGRNQQLQFLGAVWDTQRGDRIRALRPLPGDDSTSTGNAINDQGQVVGISGSCDQAVGRFSARAAVLWNPGKRRPIDLGNLGSESWNTPNSINNHGVVVGFAQAEGIDADTLFDRPFRWTEDAGMVDLGTLDGDARGQAVGINDDGLIVGLSRGAPGEPGPPHAVSWQHGEIFDLNDLAPDYDGHLAFAGDINDDGVITGGAASADGQAVAFLAVPIDDDDDYDDDDDD